MPTLEGLVQLSESLGNRLVGQPRQVGGQELPARAFTGCDQTLVLELGRIVRRLKVRDQLLEQVRGEGRLVFDRHAAAGAHQHRLDVGRRHRLRHVAKEGGCIQTCLERDL